MFKKVINQLGYLGAAKQDNVMSSLPYGLVPLSADSEILQDLPLVRFRSRYMYFNNELATSIINNIQQYESDYRINSTIEIPELKKFIVEKFEDWKDHAQHGGKTFDEFVDLYKFAMLMDGECFIKISKQNDFAECPISLQIIDADRIMTPSELMDVKHNVRAGIKYDSYGVAVGAYVLNFHPNDTSYQEPWVTNFDVVSRPQGSNRVQYNLKDFTYQEYYNSDNEPNLLHIFKQIRPNQSRGIPILSPVMRTIHCLYKFTDATLIRQIMVASVGVAITSNDPESNASSTRFNTAVSELYGDTTSGTDELDSETTLSWLWGYLKKNAEPWSAGQVKHLAIGEDIKSIDMGGPTTDIYKNFVVHNITQIASALKVPNFLIYGDLQLAGSYSSARMGMEGFRSTLESNQKFDMDKLIKPLYKMFIKELYNEFPELQQYKLNQLQKFTITPKSIAHVDPDAEAKSIDMYLKLGIYSYQEVLGRSGKDFNEQMERIAYETDIRKKLGINLVNSPTIDTIEVQPVPEVPESSLGQPTL